MWHQYTTICECCGKNYADYQRDFGDQYYGYFCVDCQSRHAPVPAAIKPRPVEAEEPAGLDDDMLKQLAEESWRLDRAKYFAVIHSDDWRAKKAHACEVLEGHCQRCRKFSEEHHLHHLHYRTVGHEVWHPDLRKSDLALLCPRCHRKIHRIFDPADYFTPAKHLPPCKVTQANYRALGRYLEDCGVKLLEEQQSALAIRLMDLDRQLDLTAQQVDNELVRLGLV